MKYVPANYNVFAGETASSEGSSKVRFFQHPIIRRSGRRLATTLVATNSIIIFFVLFIFWHEWSVLQLAMTLVVVFHRYQVSVWIPVLVSVWMSEQYWYRYQYPNHQPGIKIGIGMNVQSGIGIGMVVSVEH